MLRGVIAWRRTRHRSGSAPRRLGRYTIGARGYDLLSMEPIYRPGRQAGIELLRLQPGDRVLDIGCGTGLNFALLDAAVGPTGTVIGIDLSAQMLAVAHARIRAHGWTNVCLVQANAATCDLAGLLGSGLVHASVPTIAPTRPTATEIAWQALAGVLTDAYGLTTAIWTIAALTAASGLIVATRMYETHPRPQPGTGATAPHAETPWTSSDAAAYGQTHAKVYDRLYGDRFDATHAVTALSAAASGARVLELGLGTGRIAIPLARAGALVDGIEGSEAMIHRLREQPGGNLVGVAQADLADFNLPRRNYRVAVCAVSTLFMLNHSAQRTCLKAVALHLQPGGQLFIEAFVPDPDRFDADGCRREQRPAAEGTLHVVTSHHDPAARRIHVVHTLTDHDGRSQHYDVTLHYLTPAELDTIADAAGFTPAGRWHDWTATPARAASRDPISVYQRR